MYQTQTPDLINNIELAITDFSRVEVPVLNVRKLVKSIIAISIQWTQNRTYRCKK